MPMAILFSVLISVAAFALAAGVPLTGGSSGGGTTPNACTTSPQEYGDAILDTMGTLGCAQVTFSQLGGALTCNGGYYINIAQSTTGGTANGCVKFDYQCPSAELLFNVTSSTYSCQTTVNSITKGAHTLDGAVTFANSTTIGIDYVPSATELIWKVIAVTWSLLSGFPSGCSSPDYVTAVGTTLTCAQVQFSQLGGTLACNGYYYVNIVSSSTGGTTDCIKFSFQCLTNEAFTNITSYQDKCAAFVESPNSNGVCPNLQLLYGESAGSNCRDGVPDVNVTSPQTSTSGTFASTTLSYSMPVASLTYYFSGFIYATTATGSSLNFRIANTLGTSATLNYFCMYAAVATAVIDQNCVTAVSTTVLASPCDEAVCAIEFFGSVAESTTLGSIQINFNNPAAAGTTTIVVGSEMFILP